MRSFLADGREKAPHSAFEHPVRFDTGDSGGSSPGDSMTIALTAFDPRTDMLERTCAAIDGAPRAVRMKKPEEKWGALLEGVLHMH